MIRSEVLIYGATGAYLLYSGRQTLGLLSLGMAALIYWMDCEGKLK
jgi:hypothetical protein